jgi:hypothetical protein
MGQLQNTVDGAKTLKQEMMKEANTLQHLKDDTRVEMNRLADTTQEEAPRLRHTLQDVIDSSIQHCTQRIICSSIQSIVNTKMIKVERVVHKTLQK